MLLHELWTPLAEIAGDSVYVLFADRPGPTGSTLNYYVAPSRDIRYVDADTAGSVEDATDVFRVVRRLADRYDRITVVLDPKLVRKYPMTLHNFKAVADSGWFETKPELAGRVRVDVVGDYPDVAALRGPRTRTVTTPLAARAQVMPQSTDVPVGRDGLVRFKLPRAWYDAIVASDNPEFTQYLRRATREEGGKYFQMTPDDFRRFKSFVTSWDFVQQAQSIIDTAYAKIPSSQRPSAMVRFYFKGQPGADVI